VPVKSGHAAWMPARQVRDNYQYCLDGGLELAEHGAAPTALTNDRLLRALAREPVDVTPVWLMRQAGRYLPEYRAVRAKAGSFLNLASTPELACEVTLQPIERYPLDAAIIFSDILTIPHAMGLGLDFVEGEGPRFATPVRDQAAIASLPSPDPEVELRYVMDALRLARHELDGKVPLIGFAGSPWTLACYMVEGRSGTDFRLAKQMAHDTPELMHALLEKVAQTSIDYLNAQVDAGAQALMLFDTWGGILTPWDYQEFSLRYCQRIVDKLTRERHGAKVPIILFTKGGGLWLESMAQTGVDALGLDWTIEMGEARARVGDTVALQGNLDPSILRANPDRIRAEVAAVLDSYGPGPGHVFNLGHGITPDIDPEHTAAAIEAVHALSAPIHARGLTP
jgi:uroporphyrinogen decarboxylase